MFSNLTIADLAIVILGLIGSVILYFRHKYQYWKKKGVPYLEPRFPLGNSHSILPVGLALGIVTKRYHDDLKRLGHKFGGIFLVTEPNLVLTDPDYIRDILTKDFQHFVNRGFYTNEKDDPISAHLFAVDGNKWHQLRTKLTPTFTTGKMKMMFHTLVDASYDMIDAMKIDPNPNVDIKEILCRYTTDVIGSCAFGIQCNSFKHPDAEFRKMGQKIFDFNLWLSLKAFFIVNMPKLSLKLGVVATKKEIANFFNNVVRDSVTAREKGKIKRNDFLQLLIDLKNKEDQGFGLDEIAAQVFLFFIAGFETSSTTMNFALYEIASNEEIQDRLREEINRMSKKFDGKITYDGLAEMEYLHQVVEETLRKYPPVPTLNRVCSQKYTLRNTNIVIDEGTPVLISAFGLHRDPEFYPDPEKFDPERFIQENKSTRHPYAYIPFGEGPRNCIGLRFGLMQSKVGIIQVVKNFRISVSTTSKPLVLDSEAFLLKTVDKVYLNVQKI